MRVGLWLLVAVFGLGMMTLGGCQTMEGVGEDLESAGEAIQEKASD